MEEGKNIPLIVMLTAGSIVSIACIFYKFTLTETLVTVLLTLIGFYIIGVIVKKVIIKINRDAEEHAALLVDLENQEKEIAAKEEALAAEEAITAETATEEITVE